MYTCIFSKQFTTNQRTPIFLLLPTPDKIIHTSFPFPSRSYIFISRGRAFGYPQYFKRRLSRLIGCIKEQVKKKKKKLKNETFLYSNRNTRTDTMYTFY